MKLEKPFNSELLYNHIVHYYIDKKGITKEDANKIAQKVITRELQRHVCKDSRCGHLSYDHIKNQDKIFLILSKLSIVCFVTSTLSGWSDIVKVS